MRNVVIDMVLDRQLAFLKNLVELLALLPVWHKEPSQTKRREKTTPFSVMGSRVLYLAAQGNISKQLHRKLQEQNHTEQTHHGTMMSAVLLMRVTGGSMPASSRLMCTSSSSAAAALAAEAAIPAAVPAATSSCCEEDEDWCRTEGDTRCSGCEEGGCWGCEEEVRSCGGKEAEGGIGVEEEGLAAAEGVFAALAWEAAIGCDLSAVDVEGANMKPGSLLCTALPSDANLPCQRLSTAATECISQRTDTLESCNDSSDDNDNNLEAFQLIVLARYLLGVLQP